MTGMSFWKYPDLDIREFHGEITGIIKSKAVVVMHLEMCDENRLSKYADDR
jgi:hypothetical protein